MNKCYIERETLTISSEKIVPTFQKKYKKSRTLWRELLFENDFAEGDYALRR